MAISRRDFLKRVGQAGGYSAAFATMQALGLMPMKGLMPEPIKAEPGTGKGVKVVVLGGGIGGLVSAYELRKLGYEVVLLEARERPGGRNWTGRNGARVEFIDGTVQTIHWEEGNYQNLGPARLPSTHWTMLGYVRELGVPLEVEINTSRSTLLQNDKANGGKPVPQRKAINDTRGHVSELLAKCIRQGVLDQDFTAEDRERMMDFLAVYGPLDKAGAYVGSDRAGMKVTPGAGKQVEVDELPMDMRTLLDGHFWWDMLYEEEWPWQATMFQPVGGMDRIPYAFAKALGQIVHYSLAGDGDPQDLARSEDFLYAARPGKAVGGGVLHLRPALLHAEKDSQRSVATLQESHRRLHHGRRAENCLGEPPLLGAGLQHLRRPVVPGAGAQPGVVSELAADASDRRGGSGIPDG